MIDFKLELPADFDDYAWEVEYKGWFNGVAIFGDTRYRIVFYDQARLFQEISDEIGGNRIYFEPNLVVVEKINRLNMLNALHFLAKTGKFTDLLISHQKTD